MEIIDKIQNAKKIGCGGTGYVYKLKKKDSIDNKKIIKIMNTRELAINEYNIYNNLYKNIGIIPSHIVSDIIIYENILIMESCGKHIGEECVQQIFDKNILHNLIIPLRDFFVYITKLNNIGTIHNDIKYGNILYDIKNLKFMLIDFGLSYTYKISDINNIDYDYINSLNLLYQYHNIYLCFLFHNYTN